MTALSSSMPIPRWARCGGRTGGVLRRLAGAWLVGLAMLGSVAQACSVRGGPDVLCFGILPLNGPLESRNDWQPLLDGMAEALGQPVESLATTSYEALEGAVRRQEVDVAFLPGRMALDAVGSMGMRVVAQIASADGLPGYRAVLLAHRRGPVTAENLLASPGQWRLARGGELSMSGYVVPNLELFLPVGIALQDYFTEEIVGTHQDTALAVANGLAELATNNSADLERFRVRFPVEHARLKVVWESSLIPHAHIVVRRQLPTQTQQRIARFFHEYGRGDDGKAAHERVVLRQLHNLSGFIPADNRSLEFSARINHELAVQSALKSEWVSDQARQERLRRLDDAYAHLLQQFQQEP